MRQLLACAILTVVAATPVFAQTSQPLPVRQGNVVVQTYMETCARYPGKNSEISDYAKKNQFARTDAEFSKAVLQGEVGEVWGVPSTIGQFLIVLTGENKCAAWARVADARMVNDGFEKLVKNLARPGLTVKPYLDHVLDGAGGKYR